MRKMVDFKLNPEVRKDGFAKYSNCCDGLIWDKEKISDPS